MKVLRNIFNITIWVLLGLYLAFILTFRVSAIQRWVGFQASRALSEKLGTHVQVGRINPGFLNRLLIDNVYLYDQQGEELLTARRLGVRINLLELLLNKKISISSAQIFGAHAYIYQASPDAQPNYQFVVDSLSSKDSDEKTPLNLRINSLIMRHSSVRYDKRFRPETEGVFNPSHILVDNISAHVVLKALKDDSLNVNIRKLSLKEHSGLHIQRLAMKFECGRQHSHLSQLQLQMPGTKIDMGDIRANYHISDSDSLLISTLSYRGELKPSHITLSDLSPLLPSLKTFNSTITLSALFNGQGTNVEIPELRIGSTTGDIDIDCDGWVHDLNQPAPEWQANLNHFSLSAKTINFISENLQGEHIDLPEAVIRLGDINMNGYVGGKGMERVLTHSNIRSGAGDMEVDFDMGPDREFTADVTTGNLNLRQLLDDEKFGRLATVVKLEGCLAPASKQEIKATGTVQQFEYNNYNYRNIDVNAHYTSGLIAGKLIIDDPNIGLNIDGTLQQNDKTNDIQLRAEILNLSPKAINLTDKYGDARFFAELDANLNASDINDAKGRLHIGNLAMLSSTTNYELDDLTINTDYDDEGEHYVELQSDFATAELRGDFDYKTIAQSFTNFIANQLPTLPGLPKVNPNTKNNFSLRATIHKSDWLQRLMQVPIVLSEPLKIDGFVNDETRDINIHCTIPQFFYNGNGYRNGNIHLSTPNDSLHYDVQITKLMKNATPLDVRLQGNAYDNNLLTSLQWDNHATERHLSGIINATANFYGTELGNNVAYISIEPSRLNIHNTLWNVEPCKITYADERVNINNFTIRHGQQHLLIDGVVGSTVHDSLFVAMNALDIEYILELVNFTAVDFNGKATGQALACGVLGSQMQAAALLMVDKFEFQHGRIGMLNANVGWNNEKKQIDIHAIADDGQFPDGRKSKTYVDGFVSLSEKKIDLGIKASGTRIDFAHSFAESVLSDINGYALGSVRLVGPLSAINLTGQLVVNGEATLSLTGCHYKLKNDTIRMVTDDIEFLRCRVIDDNNRTGVINGHIHHHDLKNMTYDFYVDAQNMLVYDIPDFGDDIYCGTIYGTGRVGLHGRPNETSIDISIRPERNSTLMLNTATPDAITDQEFIRWTQRDSLGSARRDSIRNSQQRPMRRNLLADRSDLRINFMVDANPNVLVKILMDSRTNDFITLRGNGLLNASYYNKGGFQMFGTYKVTDGTYGITIQDIIKKDFTFEDGGTVTFGGDPYDANLNLKAIYAVNGVSLSDLNVGKSFSNTVRVNCIMNITGQLSAPLIEFDLDLPNVNADEKQMVRSIINGQEEMNQQVVYLLAVGRFYPQGANNSSEEEGQQSQTSLAMQSLLSGTISSQINTLLGNVIRSNDWSFGANISTGDEGWNNAEYEGKVSGRLFNNRLLINGQFGYRDKANTANSSFIGDFDVRYLLFPNGDLAIKVYNQTNDRYFTKSSLNTQGLGIIMKRDFGGIADLFGIRKKQKKK